MGAWGRVDLLLPADHWQAPVIHADGGRIMLAWSGADADEARLYALAPNDEADEGRILALRAYYPQDLRLYQAGRDTYHLLWLDAENAGDTLRLRSALINAEGVALVGALTLSNATTPHYDALPLADGSLRVIYSAGEVGASAVYTRIIDTEGRANFPTRLYADISYPQLVADEGGMRFYGLENRRIFSALWDDDVMVALGAVNLPDEMSLLGFAVQHQGEWALAFAQVGDAEGVPSVWWASAPIGEAFGRFAPLRISLDATSITTGYNGGEAQSASNHVEGADVMWLRSITRSESVLPTAIIWQDKIGVLFWEAGTVYAYQAVADTLPTQFDAPNIATAPDRHLTLTWRHGNAFALTTTRP